MKYPIYFFVGFAIGFLFPSDNILLKCFIAAIFIGAIDILHGRWIKE
jgi:hypothetical protein